MVPAGHESIEQIAALIVVIGGAIFTLRALLTRPVRDGSATSAASGTPSATPTVGRSLILVMVGLSAGAAFIHLAAAPGHFAEIGDLAGGFVAAALFQGLWIRWCLAGPSRRTMAVGIVGNLAIVAAWAWTRTVGLPVGELAGTPEPMGYPDVASVVFELLLVAGLVVRWLGLDRVLSRRPAARTIASVAVVPAIGLVLVLTSLATLAIATGLDHGLPDGMPGQVMAEHVATP